MSAPEIINPATAGGGVPVGGSGTPGKLAKFTGATTLGDSLLSESATTITSAATAQTFSAAQTWTLAAGTSALNIQSGLLNLDTTNSRVGIGMAPGAGHKLDVNGRIGGSVFSDGYLEFLASGNTALRANNTVNIGYTDAINVTNIGNVGIGTASPIGTLEVRAANPTIICSNSSVRYGYSVWNDAASEFRTGTGGAHAFALLTSNTERMRIDSSGNVGIGTASATTSAATGSLVIGQNNVSQQWAARIYGGNDANRAPVLSLFRAGNTEGIIAEIKNGAVGALALGITGGVANFNDATLAAACQVQITSTLMDISGTNYGLKLPATPGNADTQTLDCYQEAPAAATAGSGWTPTLSGAGTWGGILPVVDYARYVRVGSIVFVHVQLSGAALAVTTFGGATISLPTGIAINTTANQAVVTTNTNNGASGTGVAGAGSIYSPAFAAATRVTFQFFYLTN